MQFEQFFEFSKDHDIFPQYQSKANLSRIFHALAKLRENIGGGDIEISVISQPTEANKRSQTIDQNLFTEAVTLCALYTNDKQFVAQLREETDETLSKELLKQSLSRCLHLVSRMNESAGRISGQASNLKQSVHSNLGVQFKTSLLDKNADIMQLFRKKRAYAWFFEELEQIRKRFTPAKRAIDFDEVFNHKSMFD